MARRERRAPSIPLIVPDPSASLEVSITHLPEARQEQIVAVLPFAEGVRAALVREWPPAGLDRGRPGHRTRTFPWPGCWPWHPILVTEFTVLRIWVQNAESGELTVAAYGAEYDRLSRHLHDVTVPLVRGIGQLCMASGTLSHVELSASPPAPEITTPAAPPLPGRPVVPRPPAGPAIPTGWREHLPSPAEPGDGHERSGL